MGAYKRLMGCETGVLCLDEEEYPLKVLDRQVEKAYLHEMKTKKFSGLK